MNRNNLVLCLLAVLFLVSAVVVSDVAAAWLPPVNADVCWGDAKGTVRIRFINVGGGYYQLVGKVTGFNQGTRALFGSAVRAANVFYMTTTDAVSIASETVVETNRLVLNRTTLALTDEAISVWHDKTDPDPENTQIHYDGPSTLPHINCP